MKICTCWSLPVQALIPDQYPHIQVQSVQSAQSYTSLLCANIQMWSQSVCSRRPRGTSPSYLQRAPPHFSLSHFHFHLSETSPVSLHTTFVQFQAVEAVSLPVLSFNFLTALTHSALCAVYQIYGMHDSGSWLCLHVQTTTVVTSIIFPVVG